MNGEPFETRRGGDATPRPKSFTAVQLAMQFGLGVLLLWWITAWVNLDGRQLAQVFMQASFLPLGFAAVCFAMSMVIKAIQYRLFLPRSISNVYLIGVAMSQNALLTFLPWRMGEMSFPLLLRKDYRMPIASSVSSLVVIRLIDLLVVVTVAIFGSGKLTLQINWTVITLSMAAAVALFVVLSVIGRRSRAWLSIQSFIVRIKPIRNPIRFGILLLLSTSIFALTTIQSTLALHAMGLAVTLPDIALLNALSLLATLLPIHPPGGWGTIDSIQIVILQHLNYQPGMSVPAILAAHVFYTLLIFAGGIIGWLVRGKSRLMPKTVF